ncbi:unnamed protein product, partial [Brassica oleracea var. botrytis]
MITVLSGRLKRKMNLDKKEEPTNVFAGLELEVTKTVLSVIIKRVDRSYEVMIAFAVSGYASTEGRQCKPFNPPLGETLIHTLVLTHQSFINTRREDPRKRYVPGEIMAPKKLDTDPALEQLQQEGKQMSTTLMEQRQEWDRVKSLELAVGALQRSFDSTLFFLKPMRQQRRGETATDGDDERKDAPDRRKNLEGGVRRKKGRLRWWSPNPATRANRSSNKRWRVVLRFLCSTARTQKSWVVRLEQYFELEDFTEEQKPKAVRMCFES